MTTRVPLLRAEGKVIHVGGRMATAEGRLSGPDGKLYAQTARVEWAVLLRRTFDVDVARCARCDGPVRVRAVVTDSASVQKLLAALRRPRDLPLAVA